MPIFFPKSQIQRLKKWSLDLPRSRLCVYAQHLATLSIRSEFRCKALCFIFKETKAPH